MAVVDHDTLVATRTGGLAPDPDVLGPFAGSARLRPDGRPRREFRDELRVIADLRNVWTVAWTLALPVAIVWAAAALDRWFVWPVAVFAMGTVFVRLYIF